MTTQQLITATKQKQAELQASLDAISNELEATKRRLYELREQETRELYATTSAASERLTGAALLAKLDGLGDDVSIATKVKACGYIDTDGRLQFSFFYEALKQAKGY